MVSIINRNSLRIRLTVEVADTEHACTRGLMHRKTLGRNNGMLFVFPRDDYRYFWMKNTYLPLSIAYLDPDGIITDMQDMKPLDTTILYPSKYPSRFAIEVNQGWFRDHQIVVGSRVQFNGCLRK